jgi:GT2 family glycosyltransferase
VSIWSPQIAVVIPTRRRETRLAFALEALEVQTLPRDSFEVVVVRDGEWPEPLAEAPGVLRVRFLSQPRARGPAAARNRGWRESPAELVAFIDDDCRPAPRWLETLAAAAEGRNVFLQGRTEPDPDERHLLGGLARSQLITGASGWFEACNMAYPRGLLERLNGFDESFPGPAGEDTDLGLRAVGVGARLQYVDEALVWHAVWPRHLPTALRETWRWRFVAPLLKRHPDQRRAIPGGLFWKEAHARLLLAAAGLGTARRGPQVASALALPYLELHMRTYPRTARGIARAALDLPARVALDSFELAVTAAGAAERRTLVL